MKKFKVSLGFIFLVIIFSLLLSTNLNKKNIFLKNFSQTQISYFSLKNSSYFAECSFGYREKVFEYNGVCTQNIEYGIFKVLFNQNYDYAKNISATIKINGEKQKIILEKNPFDNSFVCDLEKIYDESNQIEICIDNIDTQYFKFNCISLNWDITYDKAKEIIYKQFYNFCSDKEYECFLFVISNKQENNTSYFWNIKIITKQLKVKNVLLDINTGDVIFVK